MNNIYLSLDININSSPKVVNTEEGKRIKVANGRICNIPLVRMSQIINESENRTINTDNVEYIDTIWSLDLEDNELRTLILSIDGVYHMVNIIEEQLGYIELLNIPLDNAGYILDTSFNQLVLNNYEKMKHYFTNEKTSLDYFEARDINPCDLLYKMSN